jgi:hypothetical protein
MENQRNDWYNTILNQLDKAAQDYHFPIFDNVYLPAAGMKIFTYRDNSEWLIAFESIVYASSGGIFLSLVTAFGNKLLKPGLQSDREVIKAHKDYAIWDEDYEPV